MYNVGVFGSAGDEGPEMVHLARRIGLELAARGCIIITGACSGLPYEAARSGAAAGAEVWGFSPVSNMEEQMEFAPNDDPRWYSTLHFVPPSFPFNADLPICKKYRNVLSTAHCEAGIIIAGKWGTLNEFTNLVDFGKVVGVLESSGGIAAELRGLVERIGIEGEGSVVIDDDPESLVARVIEALEERSRG